MVHRVAQGGGGRVSHQEDGEEVATVKKSLTVQIEGSREVQRPVALYNLDAILAVG